MAKDTKMDIWNRNCKTDPKYTKEVPKGGFKLTAIDAQYQLRMATEEFGAIGAGFGVRAEQFQIHDGILFYQAIFWYQHPEPRETVCEFCMFADIAVQANRDIAKKVQTDALTKALSRLGFNADVFLNEFDGNTYTDPVEPRQIKPATRPTMTALGSDADIDFDPVTDAPESADDLPGGMTARARASAVKIIAGGREILTGDKEYYEHLFTYKGKCYVHCEADFIRSIEKHLEEGWDMDKKFYAISKKAEEYAEANGIPF